MNKIGSKILKIDANTIPRMILEGFLYIHRKVFIHYDLKPVKQYRTKDTKFGCRGIRYYIYPESIVGEVTSAWMYGLLSCIVVQMITGRLP
ncbi:hypothetical protein ERO13_D08G226950v2 [Gossypium hirsutum]|nr:hypothetical protein ERO13_D08G226950v2 [Gossypium hirsutum]